MPAKILTRGTQSAAGIGADRVVARHRVEQVQQLPLVFVDALDVDVEQRVRIERRPGLLVDEAAQRRLVGALDRRQTLDHRRIVGMVGETRQRPRGI